MVNKIQTKVIDVDAAAVKASVSNSDYVLIQNDSTKEMEKVLVSDLLAGSAGAIRIKGEARMDDPATTPTSIVISGDPDDTTITQGTAPNDVSPNGAAYVVVTDNLNGVVTNITGVARTVFDSDQIVWTGSSWGIVEIGTRVQSVNGRVGRVTGLAEAKDVYSKSASDAKYFSATNPPKPEDIGMPLFEFTKTLDLTREWQDSGIIGTDMPAGTYIVQVFVSDGTVTRMYREYFSGVMSWTMEGTNADTYNEIPLHGAGHANYNRSVYLRTIRSNRTEFGGRLRLQIAASVDLPPTDYVFKFRKVI